MNKTYKKSYLGLVIWFLSIILLAILIPFLAQIIPGDNLSKLILVIIMAWLLTLFIVIYKGEYVYWINGGPDYETAKNASKEQRQIYAWGYLRRFLITALIFLIYMIISTIFRFDFSIDIPIFGVLVVGTAISTINIKF